MEMKESERINLSLDAPTLEWRVSPEHVDLLPASGQVPKLPTAFLPPQLHDVVQLSDGRCWVVYARLWEPAGLDYKLVLMIEPAQGMQDMPAHTLH